MKSAEQSAQTRERVIAAARRLLADSAYHRLSLESVATLAGVTRATVYYQFHSKLGLLEAVVADAEARVPLPGLGDSADSEAIDVAAFLERSCRFWSANEE